MNIVKTEGVCGGRARVNGTRLPVWLIVDYINLGVSHKGLMGMFPALNEESIDSAIDYFKSNTLEITQDITDQES